MEAAQTKWLLLKEAAAFVAAPEGQRHGALGLEREEGTETAFNIFFLSSILFILINMCLGVFLFGFILSGTCCASWI